MNAHDKQWKLGPKMNAAPLQCSMRICHFLGNWASAVCEIDDDCSPINTNYIRHVPWLLGEFWYFAGANDCRSWLIVWFTLITIASLWPKAPFGDTISVALFSGHTFPMGRLSIRQEEQKSMNLTPASFLFVIKKRYAYFPSLAEHAQA